MNKIVELKARGMRPRLREAMETGQLVRVWRQHLEPGSFCGFVCAVGPEYFLLWAVGDHIGFDGLYALRHRDVTELEAPDHSADFVIKALKWRGIEPDLPSGLPIDSLPGLIHAVAESNPLMTVHLDSEGVPEVCYVGKLLDFEADGFRLQEVTPDAQWMQEPSSFGFQEISALAWRTPYNEALAHIAGTPPELKPTGFWRGEV